MGDNRRKGSSGRLRFKHGESADTSGQLGPKSKSQEKKRKRLEKPPAVSAEIPPFSAPTNDSQAISDGTKSKLRFVDETGSDIPTNKSAGATSANRVPAKSQDFVGGGGATERADFGPTWPEVAKCSLQRRDPKSSKLRQDSEKERPSDRLRREGDSRQTNENAEIPLDEAAGGDSHTGSTDPKADKAAKRKEKSRQRMDKSSEKLNKARETLANQKPQKKPGPIKSVGRAAKFQAWRYVHSKIHQVEHENAGTEAAHKTELAGERVIWGGKRLIKRRIRTRSARQVRKWETKTAKANADYAYRQLMEENPDLKSNPVSRLWQKRKLKKQYQKQTRGAAKKGAKAAKETAVSAKSIAGAAWRSVKSNPKIILILACVFLLIAVLQSCVGALSTVGNGIISVVGGTSYVSSDSDIEAVEASYGALENALREKVGRIEQDYPGYDEYRYSVDEIGHDPFELASYLTAKYDDYTPTEVQGELQSLIDQQYILTITETVEVRYRTETRTDTWTDEDGNEHSDTYTVEVPYDYYILNVSLRNQSLGAVVLANLNPEQMERYLLYQKTQGNRPYLFEGNANVNRGEYTDYDIPPEALTDERFAAMITEAEKYLGYPYVWGGSSPSTSFDCSGFVCWVINQSGVGSVGRTTASGLFNHCAIIPPGEAQPGDLIFFSGTYDSTGPVSHVGIFVGGGMMIHCGNPISYASVNSNYWTNHFYAYGRLP